MRGLIGLVAVLVTVVVQVTVVDRIPFPGSAGPDLVLLAVAAFALASGPLAGALIGFAGGLALDVAPPGSHFVGQQALVFCLVGYLCGLAAQGDLGGRAVLPRAWGPPGGPSPRQATEHTALYEIAVMAAAVVFGEALSAALGKMLSDPRVSLPAVRHVLPAAVAYDVLLCPFVLYAAAAVLRMAGALRPAPPAEARPAGQAPAVTAQRAAPAGRQVPAGGFTGFNGSRRSAPRLRLSGRANGDGWLAGGSAGGARSPARAGSRTAAVREPRLKLGRGGSPGGSALGAPVRGAALGAAFSSGGQPKVKFGTRRGEGVLGGSLAGGSPFSGSPFSGSPFSGSPFSGSGRGPRPGKWLTGPGPGGLLAGNHGQAGNSPLARSRFGRSRMGRSLLGGSVFSRSPSSALSVPTRRPAVLAAPRFSVSSRNAQHGLLGRNARRGLLGRYGRQGTKGAFGRKGELRLYGQRQPRRYGRQGRHSRLGRLAAALRTPALARPARTSAPRGSAFRTSAPTARGARRRALGRSPGKGWLRRRPPRPALSRGAVGGKTPRLRMSRRKGANRRRRRGGYR